MSHYGKPQSSQLHGYYDSRRTYTQNSFQCPIPSNGSPLQDAATISAPVYQNTLQLVQGETITLQENLRTLSDSAEFMKTPIKGNSSDQLGACEEYNTYGYEPGGGTPTFPQYFYSPVSNVNTSPPLVVPSQITLIDPFGGLQSPIYADKPLQFSLNYDRRLPDFDAGLLMRDSSPESMEYLVPGYTECKPESSTPTPAAYYQEPKKTCSFQDCHMKFVRQEHLKRHEKTHSSEGQTPCEFCGKTFGRTDNLKSHIKLHTFPNRGNRTKFYEGAQEVYERMPRRSPKVKAVEEDM